MDPENGVTASIDAVDRDALRSVLAEYPLRLAVLFGSHARGTQTSRSDVDVGVLFQAGLPEAERREAYLDLHSAVARALNTDHADVTALDDIPPSVGRQALQSYEVLVGDPDLAEELREKYEAAAPTPTHEDLVDRLDESLATLDAALESRDRRRAEHDGE